MLCDYLRRVTSTVAVDSSWNSRYSQKSYKYSGSRYELKQSIQLRCFHENLGCMPKSDFLNLLELIRRTYFPPAKNSDVAVIYN